jgi:hypothetical protein
LHAIRVPQVNDDYGRIGFHKDGTLHRDRMLGGTSMGAKSHHALTAMPR